MNLDYIEQQDITRSYLQGKLSASESASFEEFILDKPDMVAQLELDTILLQNLAKSTNKSEQLAMLSSVGQSLHDVWKLGLAAALGALMVLPFVQYQSVSDGVVPEIEGHNHIAYLESSRSLNTTSKNIVITADVKQLILMIQPATLDENHFAVTLKQSGDEYANTYTTQSQLANSGDLIITIPAEGLKQGGYELSLNGLNSSFKQTFAFELVRTNP